MFQDSALKGDILKSDYQECYPLGGLWTGL